ncbi:MAG TPA: hypothetical protein VF533_16150 [Solirubrobacteraceae bacterium]|jgi:hypothetical protein
MRRATAWTVLTATMAFAGSFAATASAAVTNVERVAGSSLESSFDKSATASCPAGKKVTGAGGAVSPGNGTVLIDQITPDPTLSSVTVHAVEDEDGTGSSWVVTAYAICATPPPGLQRVTATSASTSDAKSVTAACPSGKRVLGVGAEAGPGAGQILLDGLRPKLDLTGAVVNALEDETGTNIAWTVTAYAMCANAPVVGLQRVAHTDSDTSATPSQTGSAPCPAGKILVGLGGEINSLNGQMVYNALTPKSDLTGAGMTAFKDDTGSPNFQSVTTYALCAAFAKRVAVTSESSADGKSPQAVCPDGMDPTGTGGAINGSLGRAWIVGSAPSGSRTVFDVRAGFSYPFTVTAAAVCATTMASREVVVEPAVASGPSTVTATCPSGKRVIGAGGFADDQSGDNRVAVDGMAPDAALTSVSMTSSNTAGEAAMWAAGAFAICAAAPPGLVRVARTSPADSAEYKSVTATCSAGKRLLGAGAAVTSQAHVVLDDMLPDAALTKVTASGAEDPTAPEGDWTVTAYAICASR